MRIQGVCLEHHGNAAVGWIDVRDVTPANLDCPFRRFLEPGDHPQQGGLAATRGANKDTEFPFSDFKVNAVNDLYVSEALDGIL